MIKGAIFDFNGTLFWDTDYHARAFAMFIERYLDGRDGLKSTPMTPQEMMARIMGKPNDLIMPIIFGKEFSKAEILRLGVEKEAIYREMCRGKVEFAPGVYELWAWLKSNGIPFTIASSADKANMDFYYMQTDIAYWIPRDSVTYNDGSFEKGKPFPDIFLLAARRLGVPAEECAIFEDSPAGIRAAEAARAAKVIVVSPDKNSYDGPHTVIDDFKDAIPLLK